MADFRRAPARATRRRAGSLAGAARAARVLAWVAALAAQPTWAQDTPLLTPDGGRYRGGVLDGRFTGAGRIDWENGAYYEGGFEGGLYAGSGRLHGASGEEYEGSFARGLAEGHGRRRAADGATYEGEFHAGEPAGAGRLDDGRGNVYEGQFAAGLFEGAGRLTTPQGVFEGRFHAGRMEGPGTARYSDGRSYRGDFAAGRYQGHGRFETAGGAEVYEGEFVDDDFTGEGTFRGRGSGTHAGHFVKWRPDGPGRYTDPEGDVYEGRFSGDGLEGTGVLRYHDGAHYEGEFKAWLPSGRGVLTRANGDTYRGGFALGLFDGEGTLQYARPRPDGTTQEQGIWHGGHLGAGTDDRAARANIETALYSQEELLARRLAALQPRRPDEINLFLLEVAGDGSQEVFRREVDFVQAQFAARFGTRGHTVQLVNSRNTVGQVPLATVTSIRRAVAALAQRMDRERDILFVFLTSHGSRDHHLLLDLEGMPLPPLQATELGDILRESGIHWKVVVVSACYGGGFIEPLDDGHTLILAAARRDRRSFGCADDNDFTYFGRAFFEQALPQAGSFQDAFVRARAMIDAWEERDLRAASAARQSTAGATRADAEEAAPDDPGDARDDGHSLPQMRSPEAIASHLARWWAQTVATPPGSAAGGR